MPPTPTDGQDRLRRLAAFTRQLHGALAGEFAPLLSRKAAWGTLPPATRQLAERLAGQLERVGASLDRAQRQLGRQQAGTLGRDSVSAPGMDEWDAMVAAARGIEGVARVLRQDRAVQALLRQPDPGPAQQKGPGGPLTRWLRRAEELAMEPGAAPEPAAAPAPPLDPAVAKRLQAFEATVQLAVQILGYVGPRLNLVKVAGEVVKLPAAPPPWIVVARTMNPAADAAEVPAAMRSWLLPLARLFINDRRAARDGQVAVEQWQQAKPRVAAAEELRQALADVPPPEREPFAAKADPGPVRAAVLPLNHLHLTFKATPLLRDLFPAPATEGTGKGT